MQRCRPPEPLIARSRSSTRPIVNLHLTYQLPAASEALRSEQTYLSRLLPCPVVFPAVMRTAAYLLPHSGHTAITKCFLT